jgi:hypothetical protein
MKAPEFTSLAEFVALRESLSEKFEQAALTLLTLHRDFYKYLWPLASGTFGKFKTFFSDLPRTGLKNNLLTSYINLCLESNSPQSVSIWYTKWMMDSLNSTDEPIHMVSNEVKSLILRTPGEFVTPVRSHPSALRPLAVNAPYNNSHKSGDDSRKRGREHDDLKAFQDEHIYIKLAHIAHGKVKWEYVADRVKRCCKPVEWKYNPIDGKKI